MPTNRQVDVKQLSLDLANYRTVKQRNEKHATQAMIAISPDRFWALLESILDDGYHATENIIVLDEGAKLVVKEGNRRIAALKYALGLMKIGDIPAHLIQKKDVLPKEWLFANAHVPCAVYSIGETGLVDRLISLTHAKGEKASRDAWTAVARARYARDEKSEPTPGLDLLEAYLKKGRNLSPQQAERWAGDYPITVLDEVLQKLSQVLGVTSLEFATQYPKHRKKLFDSILFDIGVSHLGFKEIRDKDKFFASAYGIDTTTSGGAGAASCLAKTPSSGAAGQPAPTSSKSTRHASVALSDPRFIRRTLKNFTPRGKNREKIVTLRDELLRLRVLHHPHAFCFLLRSLFEISAKVYCAERQSLGCPTVTDNNGKDKPLAKVLDEIISYMTQAGKDIQKTRVLHGSKVELGKKDGMLSVTSLNQLIHNPRFSIQPSDICVLFGNVMPLLEEMNR